MTDNSSVVKNDIISISNNNNNKNDVITLIEKKMTYATHKIHLGTPPKGLGLITVVLYFIKIKQFLEGLNLLKLVVFVKNTMDSFYFILMF
jgi:hypothetical protein